MSSLIANQKKVIFSTQKPTTSFHTSIAAPAHGIEDLLDDWNDDEISNIQNSKQSVSPTIKSPKQPLSTNPQHKIGQNQLGGNNQLPRRIIFSTPINRIGYRERQRRCSFDTARTNTMLTPGEMIEAH